MGLGVALQEVARDGVDLHRQLARGRDHQRARPVARHEARAVHQLDAGHQERQRLPGACMVLHISSGRPRTHAERRRAPPSL